MEIGTCEPCFRQIVKITCSHDGCRKLPSFNVEGERKGKFCADHKLPNMINVINKTCFHDGCRKQPNFNTEGERKGKFCTDHKLPNMINVKDKTCSHDGCKTIPAFNFEEETKGKFCADHKLPNMINVRDKTCSHDGCRKSPAFNVEGERKGKFCADHKLPNMINVISKTCFHDGCRKQPNFNVEGERKGKFCFDHKLQNMIDVQHKKCSRENCKTRASYGIPGEFSSRCSKHKSEGMCVNPSSRCQSEDCKEKALYGIRQPVHCEEHKTNKEINMCLHRCKRCSSLEILNEDGFCFEYCINSELYKRHKHHKEICVQTLLKSEINREFYSYDKVIDSNCNKYRPDIVYDCGTHFLAIEIDEHQHSSYDKSCELVRMKAVCQAFGMPTIFIRYNPDSYKGEKVPKAKRENILAEWVKFCMKPMEQETAFLRVAYLFYDGFISSAIKVEEISMI